MILEWIFVLFEALEFVYIFCFEFDLYFGSFSAVDPIFDAYAPLSNTVTILFTIASSLSIL